MTNQRKKAVTALCVLAFSGFHAANASAQASGSLQEGERMLARCLELAAREKYPPLSVGIVDESGTLIAFKRQDGASPATAEAALLKARSAVRLRVPTDVLTPAIAGDASTRDAFIIMQITTLPGGVPIADKDGRVIGAVGVSGSVPQQDTACAQEAIAAKPAKGK